MRLLCVIPYFISGRPVYTGTSKVKSLFLSFYYLICFSITACCICEVELPFNFRDNLNRRSVEIKQTFKIARAVRCPQNQPLDPKLDGWPRQSIHSLTTGQTNSNVAHTVLWHSPRSHVFLPKEFPPQGLPLKREREVSLLKKMRMYAT